MTDDVDEEVCEAYRTMFVRARPVDEDPGEQRPRSFDHALRLLIPSDHVNVIEEVTEDDA